MDSGSISTALQSMDVASVGISSGGSGSGNMEDAMQIFIKNHVLSNPITCESTKTKATTEQKEERIKRPMNAFMVFSHQARKMIAKKNPNLKNSDLSKFLGSTWKNFTEEKKAMFKRKAEELRAKHKKDHPQYKYQPRRKKSKVSAASSSIADKPVRSTTSKKATKLKEYSRLSESSASPNNSGNELYIDESVSPVSDQASSLQPNFGYQLPDNMPFDYHCNAYGNNNNSTNHNHNNSIHVNNTVATGIVNAGHRRTPCVLTPPSTPINSDLSAMNVGNGLPAHLYNTQSSMYRGATANDFVNEKVSPMYTSNAYTGHQTTAVDIYNDLYNGYSCGQSTEFGNELPAMEMPSNVYNVNGYNGFDAHKYSGEHSTYFDSEKKFDIGSGVTDASRNLCVQNGYMHYNNC
ncbi:uncharacterized protein LOC129577809 [Sitodiplosis mosellana]|uniref:uncharacterized protein LOC129577809 n=1 Tax=Sitodiplosis mosellana TaxID=263140 RepID=UPI002443FA12|nr:uncharacterized protein LOC129577809 [Sitodiplosis mosellana]